MRGPQVRFCERRGGVIHCAYSTRCGASQKSGRRPHKPGYVTEGAQILFLPVLRLAYDTCITALTAPWQK